jgi:hypothetical protein
MSELIEQLALQSCSYGADSNRVMFEYQVFCAVLTVSISPLLLFNENLHNLYKPLARLVDISLILQLICCILYFISFPYPDNGGNCAEMFVSRLTTICIMFGEFHQIYFIAKMLGLGKHNFSCGGSLERLLKFLLICSIFSISVSFFFFKEALLVVENSWTIIASSIQLYCIHLSKSLPWDRRNESIISSSDNAVVMFENLSILQLIPSTVCLVKRIVFIFNLFPLQKEFGAVFLIIDMLCNFLFYLKALLIKENSKVNIEMVYEMA